jgi:hypothetical protein
MVYSTIGDDRMSISTSASDQAISWKGPPKAALWTMAVVRRCAERAAIVTGAGPGQGLDPGPGRGGMIKISPSRI